MNKVFLLILLFDRVTSAKEIITRKRRFTDETEYRNALEQGNVQVVNAET